SPPIVSLLKEVLFDIGRVKGGHCGLVFLEVSRGSSNGFCSREISNQRDDEIPSLDVAQKLEAVFAGEITPGLSAIVACRHESRIAAAKARAEIPVWTGQ